MRIRWAGDSPGIAEEAGTCIDNNAFLTDLQATGAVRAVGAQIGGQLHLRGAVLVNEGGDALSLDNARIAGNAWFISLGATGAVSVQGAHFGGQLILWSERWPERHTTLVNKGGQSLRLDDARIDGDAFLTGLQATGEVRALGAHFGGQLDLVGAVLVNEGGYALILDDARIDNNAFLADLGATGEVRAVGAQIGGQLHLRGAVLVNEDATALGKR